MSGTLIRGTRETFCKLYNRVCAALGREPHVEKEPPVIRRSCKLLKPMCAELRREPQFENDSAPVRETLKIFYNESA
eukprot:8437189-Pyramimonas_sp.AAC.1